MRTLDDLNPAGYLHTRITGAKPRLAFDPPRHFRDPQGWQAALRPEVARLLGGLDDWEQVPLDVEQGKPEVFDGAGGDEGYTRTSVTFATRQGLRAFGFYLVPNKAAAPAPAVLCLPGHGRGVDALVGIAGNGSQRKIGKPDEYQQDFALQAVARGYVTLALEQFSFGRRKTSGALGDSSCTMDSMTALMLGETMTGWRVWDALRAIDFLHSCPEVDSARVAVMGISGGGLTALFSAALDERITACVVSGYLNTWAGSVLAVPHCPDNFVPGLLQLCDMSDLAGLVAPRPLFAESGDTDAIFPVASFRQACARAQFAYLALGKSANFGSEVFSGGHVFHGTGAFRFLADRLTSPRLP